MHWGQAALHSYLVLQHLAATAIIQQHPRLPVPCMLAQGHEMCPTFPPHTHTESWRQNFSCQSDTHLFLQLRKYHQVCCGEHTRQPGTPTAAPGWSNGGGLQAPMLLLQQPAQPVWVGSPAPCQPACGTQLPTVHLRDSVRCCTQRDVLPRAACLEAVVWLQLSLVVHALKARPALLMILPHGRSNVTAVPPPGRHPLQFRAVPRRQFPAPEEMAGELERMAPSLGPE